MGLQALAGRNGVLRNYAARNGGARRWMLETCGGEGRREAPAAYPAYAICALRTEIGFSDYSQLHPLAQREKVDAAMRGKLLIWLQNSSEEL